MDQIVMTALLPLAGVTKPNKTDDPAKVKDAAQQFEALLIGQILKSVREGGSGWLGSGGDASNDVAMEYAEQHFATTIAKQGGLGLEALISQGLKTGH